MIVTGVGLWAWLGLAAGGLAVAPPACAPVWLDPPGLQQLLSLETSTTTSGRVVLEVPDCARAPETLRVRLLLEGRLERARSVPLRELDERVRLRTLALVIGEMIDAADPELPPPPPTGPKDAPAEPPSPSPVREPEPAWRTIVGVIILGRFTTTIGTTTLGARAVGAAEAPSGAWSLGLDLGAETGRAEGELGAARMIVGSFGASAHRRWPRPTWSVAVGPRFELGYATINGQPNQTRVRGVSTNGVISAAELELIAELNLAEDLVLRIELGGGAVLRGLVGTAEGVDLLGLGGAQGRLALGLTTDW